MSRHFTPEYLHVLLNPLPVYGVALGLLGLVIALFLRSRPARLTALALVFVSAISAWPVYQYGEASEDGVLPLLDADGRAWLEEHERRAEQLILLLYATALLAAGAALTERFAPRAAVAVTVATALLATGSLVAGTYIAAAGGRIRHREFRYVPPPEPEHENAR